MRIVIALGGNALLRRGEPMTPENQRANIRVAAEALATIYQGNELVITHGNGPQVGLLALQGAAHGKDEGFPLDVLGSQTEGMIGYVIEQELGNLIRDEVPLATVLTMIEVDATDPAFQDPMKFIGPPYEEQEAHALANEKGWAVRQDGGKWRRVVASPKPLRICEIRPIRWLLEKGTVIICAGGGGIPCVYDENGKLHGIEAVIDKDLASELLARELEADLLIMATDVAAVFSGWNTERQKAIKRAAPKHLRTFDFPAGSMGPKVEAACQFAELGGKTAVIGALHDLRAMIEGVGGTTITTDQSEIEWH